MTELDNPVYAWLDGFSFKSNQRQYDTRFARFIALVGELNLLTAIRGPTVTAVHNDLRIAADPVGGLAPVDLYATKPTYNAIQLTKLGFLGGPALGTLVAGAADGASPALHKSTICGATPHIICDVSQSLDIRITTGSRRSSRRRPTPNARSRTGSAATGNGAPGACSRTPASCRRPTSCSPRARSAPTGSTRRFSSTPTAA